MNFKHKAALFFLSDTDEETVGYYIQDLEEVEDTTTFASLVVNVWNPFENYTVDSLLDEINSLETLFEEAYNKGRESVLNIKIRADETK